METRESSRKKRCINPTTSSLLPDPERHDNQVYLPEEMWDQILRNLRSTEEDLETFRSCAVVCQTWNQIIKRTPPKIHWSPWLKFGRQHPNLFLFNSPATNFWSGTDVLRFLSELPAPGSAEDGRNPFNFNQTVRLKDRIAGQEKEIKEIGLILKKYGSCIKQLFYLPNDSISNELAELPRLLQGMSNLQTLIVDLHHLSETKMTAIRGEDFPKNLHNLVELVIVNDLLYSESAHAKLAVNYGQQVKYLTMSHGIINPAQRTLLDRFPALEHLKVEKFICNWWPKENEWPSGNSWPKLKSLALGLPDYVQGSVEFKNVMRLVAYFSSTLELLSLNIIGKEEQKKKCWRMSSRGGGDSHEEVPITEFPELNKLIVPFSFVSRSQCTLEVQLGLQSPELKSVILHDMKDEFKNQILSPARVAQICRPIWGLVPPSTETIGLKAQRWNEHLKGYFPVVYKCTRNPVN